MTSRYKPTREPRELLTKRTFLGNFAPNEREEKVLQYVIHCTKEDVCRDDVRCTDERVCAPRARRV